ncbi:hypothetical protein MMC25_008333 [Agyrium rufum]|nr:hypothetical protein [Agyrium rufum]
MGCNRPEDAYDVGMNIAQGTDSLSGDIAETISNLWYNNEMQNFPQYNSNNEDLSNFENWGNYLGEFMQVGTPLGHPTLAVVNGVVEGLPRINSK